MPNRTLARRVRVAVVWTAVAMAAAAASGEPVMVDELTTEHRLVTADPVSGQLVAELTAMPVRVPDGASGGWVDVDPTLRAEPDGTVRRAAASVELAFSGGGRDAPLARMAKGGRWLALAWPRSLPSLPEPVLNGAVATYPDAVGAGHRPGGPGRGGGVSHYLVVRDAEAARHPALARFTLGLTSSGVGPGPCRRRCHQPGRAGRRAGVRDPRGPDVGLGRS